MDNIQVPEFFICPISLQIMKDPVTVISGLTYDRDSIEHWLFDMNNETCPLTKQPLPRDSELTPNHMLRRLIQGWCTTNASLGIDRIPTPKAQLNKFHFVNLVRDLRNPKLQTKILRQLVSLGNENERNRKCMVESNVHRALFCLLVKCSMKCQTEGVEEAVSILQCLRIPLAELKLTLVENDQIIDSLMWVLGCEFDNQVQVKSHTVLVLKRMIEAANPSPLECVKPSFIETIMGVLREGITQQVVNAALHILLESCQRETNRVKILEAGAVFTLIELELSTPNKRKTELIFRILLYLCSCADGRAQFLGHRGAIAVLSERMLRVSPTADYWAVTILSLICKFSGSNAVIQEMLKVGAVSKLCMLLQVDCAADLKDRASNILRSFSHECKNSPCFDVSHSTKYK